MRKIVMMNETERQAFLNFCESVKNMEGDKDTFLKAARLERTEKTPRLSGEQISGIAYAVCGLLALLGFLSIMLLGAIL